VPSNSRQINDFFFVTPDPSSYRASQEDENTRDPKFIRKGRGSKMKSPDYNLNTSDEKH
jgi:hypothetical protein